MVKKTIRCVVKTDEWWRFYATSPRQDPKDLRAIDKIVANAVKTDEWRRLVSPRGQRLPATRRA